MTPYLPTGRALVVVATATHGGQTVWRTFSGALAADPDWLADQLPDWDGSAQALAVADDGALLAAGVDHMPLLQGSRYRSVLRLVSHDAVADPPLPRIAGVRLRRTAHGQSVAFALSVPARVSLRLLPLPVGRRAQVVALPVRTLAAGRHALAVRGLTYRTYRVLIELCTPSAGCHGAPAVTVTPR